MRTIINMLDHLADNGNGSDVSDAHGVKPSQTRPREEPTPTVCVG